MSPLEETQELYLNNIIKWLLKFNQSLEETQELYLNIVKKCGKGITIQLEETQELYLNSVFPSDISTSAALKRHKNCI